MASDFTTSECSGIKTQEEGQGGGRLRPQSNSIPITDQSPYLEKRPNQNAQVPRYEYDFIIIEPESDHCLLLSVTTWLTDSCFWDLNDVTMVDEYGKLRWQRKLGPKWDADVWLRFWGWIWFWRWFLVNVLKPKFGQEWKLRFKILRLWGLVEILTLKFDLTQE